jgi:ubiquinone/menaquinone biosynthesis C-methylase UbiE
MRKEDERFILNLGCGEQGFGDVRMDFAVTPASNLIADAQHLPFRDDVFTDVYERNLLEHLPNPAQHLQDVKRVMRTGGVLTLITDNAACLKYYVLRTHMGGYRKHGGKDLHYALFTAEHIKNLFEYVGLTVDKVKYIDTDYFTRFFDWAVRMFVPSLSYPRIEAQARKP